MNGNDLDTKKPQRFMKFKQWLKKHRVALIIIAVAVLVFGAFMGYLYLKSPANNPTISNSTPKPKPKPPEKFYSSLTGIEVSDQSAIASPVTAVMIENSPDARPQSGLKRAGVIYEAVAEGGITRFLTVFQGEKPELIGPVRSLRYYYLNWAAPYQASIAHVGGSYNALQEVRNGNYRDADQFFNPGTYWRSTDRVAPHNVYTSGAKLDELNQSKGWTSSNFTSFLRVDGKPASEPNATSIQLNFSSWLFNTSYTYNQTTNSYDRLLAGSPHSDREGGQLSPSVVVAIEATTSSRGGTDGYEDIVTTGSGKATVFQDGLATPVTWHKKSMLEPLELLNEDGTPIKLVRGQTWIAVITPTGSVSWQ